MYQTPCPCRRCGTSCQAAHRRMFGTARPSRWPMCCRRSYRARFRPVPCWYVSVEPVVRAQTSIWYVPPARPEVVQLKVLFILQSRTTVHGPPGGNIQNLYSPVLLHVPLAVNVTAVPAVCGEAGLALTETAEQRGVVSW